MLLLLGQYIQSVYPPGEGSYFDWAFNKDMHLTEKSDYATRENGVRLYSEWRNHWNLSKPVLLEKSPRHMLMTRLLQFWFGSRAHFVAIIRHPLGMLHRRWERPEHKINRDCGEAAIQHWLHIYGALRDDLQSVSRKAVIKYEELIGHPGVL